MSQQDQNKLKKRLEALLKLPENQVCADCRKRGILCCVKLESKVVLCIHLLKDLGGHLLISEYSCVLNAVVFTEIWECILVLFDL